jgi:hypothetical protein
VRFAFIQAEKANWPVSLLCRALKVTRAGFYAWLRRGPSRHRREDERLRVHVRATFKRSRKTYGAPRIHDELKESGETVSKKRVARLMREEGIVARKKRKFVATTQSNHALATPPNVMARDFRATRPNEKWVGDITYLRTHDGFLYLATLMDLFSRRIVGWAFSETLETTVASQALEMAFATRHVEKALIHHTDRGVQYASVDYRKRLGERDVICSMSRKGDCWDNAVAESFFATLKIELGAVLNGGASRTDVRSAVIDYLDFYNSRRRHSALGYANPVQYEESARVGRAA